MTPMQTNKKKPQNRNGPFQPGDLVRLRTGWTAMKVVATSAMQTYAIYHPDYVEDWKKALHDSPANGQVRAHSQFIRWIEDDPELGTRAVNHFKTREETENMSTLYKWTNEDGAEVYGVKLTEDSLGRFVMEAKGGAVVALDRAKIEKVLPYTVEVAFDGGTKVHYRASKTLGLAVGDLLLLEPGFAFCRVTAVDTKFERARSEPLQGVKLAATPLVEPSADEG